MPVCVCAYKLTTLIYEPLSLLVTLITYKCVRSIQPVLPSHEGLGCFVLGCHSPDPRPHPRSDQGVRGAGWGKPGAENDPFTQRTWPRVLSCEMRGFMTAAPWGAKNRKFRARDEDLRLKRRTFPIRYLGQAPNLICRLGVG